MHKWVLMLVSYDFSSFWDCSLNIIHMQAWSYCTVLLGTQSVEYLVNKQQFVLEYVDRDSLSIRWRCKLHQWQIVCHSLLAAHCKCSLHWSTFWPLSKWEVDHSPCIEKKTALGTNAQNYRASVCIIYTQCKRRGILIYVVPLNQTRSSTVEKPI